jgi:hypothetical protein
MAHAEGKWAGSRRPAERRTMEGKLWFMVQEEDED